MNRPIHLIQQSIDHQLVRSIATLHGLAGLRRLDLFAGFDGRDVRLHRLADWWKQFDFLYRRRL